MESAATPLRWQLRFLQLERAVTKLSEFLDQDEFSELEQQGVIQSFEYAYELAWKTLQDYLRAEGITEIAGPRSVFQAALKAGLISDHEAWTILHKDRTLTVHTYDPEMAEEVFIRIRTMHFKLFIELVTTLHARR